MKRWMNYSLHFCYNCIICTIVSSFCLFEQHENKRFEANCTGILETVPVRAAAQCKLKCKSYDSICRAANLIFSKYSNGFLCELLSHGQNFSEPNLIPDKDCTFIMRKGT